MQKTWNLTYYQDGEPVAERSGVSHEDAVLEIYRLSRGEEPTALAAPERTSAPSETGELALAA